MNAPALLFPALLCAFVLSAMHLFASRLRFLEGIPRSVWLSIAGGVSVSYIFLHLLPEIAERSDHLHVLWSFLETNHGAFLIALIGLVAFYGLERAVLTDRRRDAEDNPSLFYLHLASFGLYNALVGYLLVRWQEGLEGLLWFALAMALHFIVNDYGLRQHHRDSYRASGRWILAGTGLAGWATGALVEVSDAVVVALMAFLAGGVVLNVLKEELPAERESRFSAFLAGAAAYAALLLSTG